MILVDASLAVKWFIDEADRDLAFAFLAEFETDIAGPDFLAIEVSRALVAAVNSRRVEAETGRAAIGSWLAAIAEQRIRLLPTDVGIIQRGIGIALDLGHPLSDCLYLALALDRGVDLVTCDARFHARATSHYPGIRLLNRQPH